MPLPSATATPCRPAMASPTTSSTSNPSIATPPTTAAPCWLRAAKLHVVSSVAKRHHAAFDISRPTLARAVKRYREHGEDAFFEPRRRRGRTVVDAQMAATTALLASGMSGSACARHLGMPPTTFNENRRAGVIAAPAPALAAVVDAPQVATDHPTSANTEPAAATDRATRDARDKHAPMGRAARDVERRTLASAGLLTEATPVFAEPAHGVARGGVLAALPMLLREGLLDAANRLFRLPAGFYGLTTILLFVACLTLARVRNPEALRYQAPGEWGAILGLDAAPSPRRCAASCGCSPAPSTPCATGKRHWLAAGPPRTGRRLGHAGRGRPRESVHWAQRSAAETLRRAPEAVFAGLRELLGQRPRRSAPAVPARRWTRSWSRRSSTTSPLGETGRGAASGPRPDQAAGRSAGAYPGVRPRGLEPGPVQASGPARHRLHPGTRTKGEDWPEEDFRTLEVLIHGPAGTSALTSPRNR